MVEDAAQALMSTYRGRPLGALGDLGALSFHETKNVISGEGGALLVPNDSPWLERAEIIREKGTDRSQFFRGEVDRYSWIDIGSSYLPSELNAAFLSAQLEERRRDPGARLRTWSAYHDAFAELERRGLARRPIVPAHCAHNAHLYYLLLESAGVERDVPVAPSGRRERGVALCPAAQLARRTSLRARDWRPATHALRRAIV